MKCDIDHYYEDHCRRTTYMRVKHVIDRLGAASSLVVLAPLFAAVAFAVRLDSPGPVLFRQRRIGQYGRPFTMLKFRSMFVDAPSYSLKVRDDDPRVTRVGRLLRRTALDELPQLWNIVRGEMSWVGPRPEQPFLVEGYAEWQRARLLARPGLTGWWQIWHRSGEQMHEHTELDIYYVENLSFGLDVKIVLLTPWALWRQDNAQVTGVPSDLAVPGPQLTLIGARDGTVPAEPAARPEQRRCA